MRLPRKKFQWQGGIKICPAHKASKDCRRQAPAASMQASPLNSRTPSKLSRVVVKRRQRRSFLPRLQPVRRWCRAPRFRHSSTARTPRRGRRCRPTTRHCGSSIRRRDGRDRLARRMPAGCRSVRSVRSTSPGSRPPEVQAETSSETQTSSARSSRDGWNPARNSLSGACATRDNRQSPRKIVFLSGCYGRNRVNK